MKMGMNCWLLSSTNSTFVRVTNYSQQDATFLEFIYFYRRSTCFRRFLRPSSGAHNCTYSFRYCQPILLLAATVEELALATSWWWAEEPPETFRASVKIIKFKKSCILLAVSCNYITMHGHKNIKLIHLCHICNIHANTTSIKIVLHVLWMSYSDYC
jgi:hypothetical protein